MTITVKGPDGNSYQFPDGTPPEVMQSAMQKRYGGPQNPQNQTVQNPPQPQAGSAVQGQMPRIPQALGFANTAMNVARGASLGGTDHLQAGIQSALPFGEAKFGDYKGNLQNVRDQNQTNDAARPVMSTIEKATGAIGGIGKLGAAKLLPSAMIKGKGLAATSLGLGLDGAAISGAEAAINGREIMTSMLSGGGAGVVANAVTRGAGSALAPLLKGKKPQTPSTQDVLQKASDKYKEVDAMEIEFDKSSASNLLTGIKDDLLSPKVGLDKKLHRGTRGLLKDMQEFSGKSVPWRRLQDFKSRAKSIKSSGGRDGETAEMVLKNIDEFVRSNPKTLTGDASKLSSVSKEADELYRRGSNAKTLEEALELKDLRTSGSGTGGNADNNIRQAMINMLAQNKTSKFLSKSDKEALKKGVKASKTENAARLFGRGFSPTTSAIHQLATGGALVSSGGMTAPLHHAGLLAKQGSDKAAASRADDVIRMLRSGGDVKSVTRTQNKVQKTLTDEEKKKELARLLTIGAVAGSQN